MKKHFINGLLILAMIFVSVGTFSSCKDNIEDDMSKVETNLQDKITGLENRINTLQELIENSKCNCASKWAQIEETIRQLNEADKNNAKEIEALKGQLNNLLSQFGTLQGQVNSLTAQFNNLQSTLDGLKDVPGQIQQLQNQMDNLANQQVTITIGGTPQSGTLSDVINDIYKYIDAQDAATRTLITEAKTELEGLINANKLLIQANQTKISELEGKVATNTGDIAKLKEEIAKLQQKDIELEGLISKNTESINKINTAITEINNTINSLKPDIQKGVDAYEWMLIAKNQISGMQTSINNLEDAVAKLQQKDKDLEKLINDTKTELEGKIDNLSTKYTELEGKLTTLSNTVSALDGKLSTLDGKVTTLSNKVNTLESSLNTLKTQVDNNTAAISQIKADLAELTGTVKLINDRLNELVTGIIIQATNNPVLGSVNLPLDVNSNMLLAQFGYAQNNFTFPSNSSRAEYNNEVVFTAQDIAMLKKAGNFKSLAVSEGDCLMDGPEAGKANAGTVYLTINPNNVDFTGIGLSLVNSQDTESGVKLNPMVKSNKLLTFGVSRSASDNGFYETQAVIDENNLEKAKVVLDKASLKTALKNAINNKTISNLANLSVVMLKQFNGKVQANALKAAWQAPNSEGVTTDYATYSKYGIAAAAYNPLSFKFYYGQAAPSALRMPVITPISGNIIDASKFNFHIDAHSSIKGDIKIDLGKITIDEDKVIITLTATTKTGETITINGYAKDVKGLIEEIDKQLATASAEINAQIEKLVADINAQVDKMMEDIAGQINEQLKDLIADINGEINGKLDRVNNYIERYNQIAEKVNSMLENPNAYLQVMMCYKGVDGGWHQLSNSKVYPTVMNLAGGNAITLLPTTYTGEILASSFKKFIGVTNVWANGNEAVSAANGDATCLSLLNNANTAYLMNQPITGQTHRVPFAVSKAGYTYEIVYSALDFSGCTSTRKFYVTVK